METRGGIRIHKPKRMPQEDIRKYFILGRCETSMLQLGDRGQEEVEGRFNFPIGSYGSVLTPSVLLWRSDWLHSLCFALSAASCLLACFNLWAHVWPPTLVKQDSLRQT